jgi:hypothetical protein
MCMRADAMGASPARGVQLNYKSYDENVRVEYFDEENFRFVTETGPNTVMLNGAIYLIAKTDGRSEQVYLLTDRETLKSSMARLPPSRTALLPPAASVEPATDAPRAITRVFSKALTVSEFRRAGGQPVLRITSAEDQALAKAQQNMRRAMTSMDMSVCGGAVQVLVAWWLPEFIDRGQAVIATNLGIEMRDAPRALAASFETWLPRDVKPIDYRVVSGNK